MYFAKIGKDVCKHGGKIENKDKILKGNFTYLKISKTASDLI